MRWLLKLKLYFIISRKVQHQVCFSFSETALTAHSRLIFCYFGYVAHHTALESRIFIATCAQPLLFEDRGFFVQSAESSLETQYNRQKHNDTKKDSVRKK